MKRSTFLTLCVTAAALFAGGCKESTDKNKAPAGGTSGGGSKPAPSAGSMKIAVIPKGTTHVFWKGVERGAKKAGDELGVEIIWKGPAKEDNLSDQIKLVQQFITDKVDAIVLAPLDGAGLVKPVTMAREAKIPVVIFDSRLDGEAGKDFEGFVGTDNGVAGKMGGEHLAKLLGNTGSAVILRYAPGSRSTGAREDGAMEGLKGGHVTLSSDNQYAGVDQGSAKAKALSMMDTIKASQGVFCPNESSTAGMLLALRQSGIAGKIKFVGFDSSEPLVAGLKAGEIDALVVQNPEKMGYLGVKAAVAAKKGEKVDANIDTGAVLVTKDNLETPEVKALIP